MEPKLTLNSIIFDLGSSLFYQLLLRLKIFQMLALRRILNKIFSSALVLQIVNLVFVLTGPSCPCVLRKVISSVYLTDISNSNFHHSGILP